MDSTNNGVKYWDPLYYCCPLEIAIGHGTNYVCTTQTGVKCHYLGDKHLGYAKASKNMVHVYYFILKLSNTLQLLWNTYRI
jgi:hypothetical protein